MKFALTITGAILGVILFFSFLAFVTGNIDLAFYEYFGTEKQRIETKIYKETEMYNESKVQDLAKIYYEYSQADSEGKKALKSLIRHRFADYNPDRLPPELAKFLKDVRGF